MPRNKKFEGDMTQIGTQRTPPFAHISHALFEERNARFIRLSPTSPIKNYIDFLCAITKAQDETRQQFKDADLGKTYNPDAANFTMPPVNLEKLIQENVFSEIAQDFFGRLVKVAMPEDAKIALDTIRSNSEERNQTALNLVQRIMPLGKLAQHIFVLGALQIGATLGALKCDSKQLKPQEANLCPSCGGTHSASVIVGWGNAEGTRFCSCLYCGTLWNLVRVKCTFCDSTGGIEYREIEGGPGTITAETCKNCGKYCKQMNHQKDIHFNVFADDIGSLALDLLMQEDNKFKRGAFNPFMMGF